jgi:hypothetical protein
MRVTVVARDRRVVIPAVSLFAVLAGLALVLLAFDVARTTSAIGRGDVSFRANAAPADPWTPSTILPSGLSRSLLGVGDDLEFRDALRSFRLSEPRRAVTLSSTSFQTRGDAELELAERVAHDPVASRRSSAENLLGVLVYLGAADLSASDRGGVLTRAAADFREAIELDPTNHDAAYNLELTLRLLRDVRQSQQNNDRSSRVNRRSRAAGAGVVGSGY